MIAVVDAGTGNLRSVVRALEAAALETGRTGNIEVTADPDVIARADRLVMPGQGAFGDCSAALARDGGALAQAVTAAIRAGKEYLGICLGMQVLFGASDEAPGCAGLGVFQGTVRRIEGRGVKVPHVGWNQALAVGEGIASLGADEWYYFVHSYAVVPDETGIVAARTEHGGVFVSAVSRDNVLAVQFHPEKSQRAGIALLVRWLERSR